MRNKIIIGTNEFTFDKTIDEYIGKLKIWERQTDVFLNIEDTEEEDIEKIVTEKINWIESNREKIVNAFMLENDHYVDVINEMIESGDFKADGSISADDFINALFINNVSIWVKGGDTNLGIDLDAAPDYLLGHLAYMEIDSHYEIEFGGLNG